MYLKHMSLCDDEKRRVTVGLTYVAFNRWMFLKQKQLNPLMRYLHRLHP